MWLCIRITKNLNNVARLKEALKMRSSCQQILAHASRLTERITRIAGRCVLYS